MTKVQAQFVLTSPIDEDLMNAIAKAHSVYGIHLVRLAPSMDFLTVEYDASRLNELDVEATLHRLGIPAKRKSVTEPAAG
ncbi:MAG: hypothetical protein ACK5AZ_05260 [Bryobacteraceae bacterium]